MDWASVYLLQGLLQMSMPRYVSKCLRVDGCTGSYTRGRGARLWALSLILGHLKAAPGIQYTLLVVGSPQTMGLPPTSLPQPLFLLFTFLAKTLRSCPLCNCPQQSQSVAGSPRGPCIGIVSYFLTPRIFRSLIGLSSRCSYKALKLW